MKTLTLSVLLLALLMGGCESGSPTDPGPIIECKQNDPRDVCRDNFGQPPRGTGTGGVSESE